MVAAPFSATTAATSSMSRTSSASRAGSAFPAASTTRSTGSWASIELATLRSIEAAPTVIVAISVTPTRSADGRRCGAARVADRVRAWPAEPEARSRAGKTPISRTIAGSRSGPAARRRGTITAPLRAFLRTEAGSAGVLVAAIVAALVWANVADGSYESFWRTELSDPARRHCGSTRDLRTWVNSGLMTLFFLVVGLEARREFDLGDLRDRRRFVLPALAGVVGMADAGADLPGGQRGGGAGAHGWGVAMSTDTALALGLLALLGRGVPDQVRIFLLTVFVVDDLVALVVIAVVYSEDDRADAAAAGARWCFAAMLGMLRGSGCAAASVVRAVRRRAVGGAAGQRRRPGGVRAGDRADRARVHPGPRRPGAGQRPVPAVPRAAHRRAGPDRRGSA